MTTQLPIMIVEFIIGLSLLAFLHELGHFLASRLFNIEVEEFGLGFPPRLLKLFTWKGTEFTLNWIPFGAFVRPKGENDPNVAGGMAAANPWKRLVVLLGGPAMNILTGIILFAYVFVQAGSPVPDTVRVKMVVENSAAQAAGLQVGDLIQQINDTPIHTTEDLSTVVRANPDKPVTLLVKRGEQTLSISATPKLEGTVGKLGIEMGQDTTPLSWTVALPEAASFTLYQTGEMLKVPVRLIQGSITPAEARPVGPVGMFNLYSQAAQRDQELQASSSSSQPVTPFNTLWLVAIISVALGVTNLLPLPALDGGRILFALPEILISKRVPADKENLVHFIGFIALLLLLVLITINDIRFQLVPLP